MPSQVIVRAGQQVRATSGEYVPSRSSHPRAQQFQTLEQILGSHPEFVASFGEFLSVRAMREVTKEHEGKTRKAGIYSDQGVKREVHSFRKNFLPRLTNLKAALKTRTNRLSEIPADLPKAPTPTEAQIGLRMQWWNGLPPSKRDEALAKVITGGDQELAGIMNAAPWAFGLSPGSHDLIARTLGLVYEAPPETQLALSACNLLEQEIAEFEGEITSGDPNHKPAQQRRSEMTDEQRHAYLLDHGSKAYMALPE